jgi:drug/metabolite transporter (DMT)-like permease
VEIVGLLVLCQLVQATAALLIKHGVVSVTPALSVRQLVAGFGPLLRRLAGNRAWLLGNALAILGAGLGLQALASADLVVVKALSRLETLFVLVGGAALLGERLTRRESAGALAIVLGAVPIGLGAVRRTGSAPPRSALLALVALCGALLAGVALARAARPRRVPRELALALGLGTLLACSDVATRLAIEVARSAGGAFSVARLSSLAALASTPEFGVVCLAIAGQLVLVQGAFANGRVAVVGPVSGMVATVLPIAFAALALGERLDAPRVLGLASMLAGVVMISTPKRVGAAPPRPPRPAARAPAGRAGRPSALRPAAPPRPPPAWRGSRWRAGPGGGRRPAGRRPSPVPRAAGRRGRSG